MSIESNEKSSESNGNATPNMTGARLPSEQPNQKSNDRETTVREWASSSLTRILVKPGLGLQERPLHATTLNDTADAMTTLVLRMTQEEREALISLFLMTTSTPGDATATLTSLAIEFFGPTHLSLKPMAPKSIMRTTEALYTLIETKFSDNKGWTWLQRMAIQLLFAGSLRAIGYDMAVLNFAVDSSTHFGEGISAVLFDRIKLPLIRFADMKSEYLRQTFRNRIMQAVSPDKSVALTQEAALAVASSHMKAQMRGGGNADDASTNAVVRTWANAFTIGNIVQTVARSVARAYTDATLFEIALSNVLKVVWYDMAVSPLLVGYHVEKTVAYLETFKQNWTIVHAAYLTHGLRGVPCPVPSASEFRDSASLVLRVIEATDSPYIKSVGRDEFMSWYSTEVQTAIMDERAMFIDMRRNMGDAADMAHSVTVQTLEVAQSEMFSARDLPDYRTPVSTMRRGLAAIYDAEAIAALSRSIDHIGLRVPFMATLRLSPEELGALSWMQATKVVIDKDEQGWSNRFFHVLNDDVPLWQAEPLLAPVDTSKEARREMKHALMPLVTLFGKRINGAGKMPLLAHTIDRYADGVTWLTASVSLLRRVDRHTKLTGTVLRDRNNTPLSLELDLSLAHLLNIDLEHGQPYTAQNFIWFDEMESARRSMRWMDMVGQAWQHYAEESEKEYASRVMLALMPSLFGKARNVIGYLTRRTPVFATIKDRENLVEMVFNLQKLLCVALGVSTGAEFDQISAAGRNVIKYIARWKLEFPQ